MYKGRRIAVVVPAYNEARHVAGVIGALPGTGTMMPSVLPLILGFQLILQAIVHDIQESPK